MPKIDILNLRKQFDVNSDEELYFYYTDRNNSVNEDSNIHGLKDGKIVPIQKRIYIKLNTIDYFEFTKSESGRLYILSDNKNNHDKLFDNIKSDNLSENVDSNDSMPEPPFDKGIFFGWIEFTYDGNNTNGVWINLTNVDMVGLPLSLEFTDHDTKTTAKLGYKVSTKKLIETVQAELIDEKAIVTCHSGNQKLLLAPSKQYESYPSLDNYVKDLCKFETKISIFSDAGEDAIKSPSILFEGKFTKQIGISTDPNNDSGVVLTTKNEQSVIHELKIPLNALSGKRLYECDGAYPTYSLLYGIKGTNLRSYPLNTTKDNWPGYDGIELLNDEAAKYQVVVTNSIYRNILTAINQGYLLVPESEDQPILQQNIYTNNAYNKPFVNLQGNRYAQILHESSNSYGFPYSDGNLKVLTKANPDEPIKLVIHDENNWDEKKDNYYQNNINAENTPSFSFYEFAFGPSKGLANFIAIGNCRYIQNKVNYTFGGKLPFLLEWEKMYFSQNEDLSTYVWIRSSYPTENNNYKHSLEINIEGEDGNDILESEDGGKIRPEFITNNNNHTQKLEFPANIKIRENANPKKLPPQDGSASSFRNRFFKSFHTNTTANDLPRTISGQPSISEEKIMSYK